MKGSTLPTIGIVGSCFVLIVAFQNCSRADFSSSGLSSSLKAANGIGDSENDDILGVDDDGEGEEGCRGDKGGSESESEESEWLYIPGGRGHVPMSSVAICPAGSKDEGQQKCPIFCFQGVDYVMHKSLAREYFAIKFDEKPNYGGGAVPGTCANPDLKIK